jgi:hypothetical protein
MKFVATKTADQLDLQALHRVELVNIVGRTQLFNPGDLDNVKKIQAGYRVQP